MNESLDLVPEFKAYLACALSRLTGEQRREVFVLSHLISKTCSKCSVELYEPRKDNDPVWNKDVPDTEVFKTDRQNVLESDMLILLSHYPSFGAGQELDFAYNALLPIIVIRYDAGTRSQADAIKVSRMVTGIPSTVVQVSYGEPEELVEKLSAAILALRPGMRDRRRIVSRLLGNSHVGEAIRALRRRSGMTQEQLASTIPGMTPSLVEQFESNSDLYLNPSLLQLGQLATALGTTTRYLVSVAGLGGWNQEELDAISASEVNLFTVAQEDGWGYEQYADLLEGYRSEIALGAEFRGLQVSEEEWRARAKSQAQGDLGLT